MQGTLGRLLDSPRVPYWGAGISLLLGLFFVFAWAPHPWGWQGIDQYHEFARALARGEPFGTTDVPWGYAYFVAAVYAAFGERLWIPVTLQVVANAAIPVMLYHLVLSRASRRTAALASLLAAAFSFNTVYASTQAADAICTVLFLASLVSFARGARTGETCDFVVSGLLSGLVPQFRPNMILFPPVLAAAYLLRKRGAWPTAAAQAGVFLALASVALAPWVVRNYRLTGAFLPTSTHGGIQLWYGSLQVGPYLESRAYNPRSVFEASAFDYTSLAGRSIIVTAYRPSCRPPDHMLASLVYWTDRDPRPTSVAPSKTADGFLTFDIPGQPIPTTISYRFELRPPAADQTGMRRQTPSADEAAPPLVYFVADDHLGDLDREGLVLDVFDLVRLIRHIAWGEPLPSRPSLDFDGDSRAGEEDLKATILRLLGDGATADLVSTTPLLRAGEDQAELRLADGSHLTVPRRYSGRVTDLEVDGGLTRALIPAHRVIGGERKASSGIDPCRVVANVSVNDVFYRREPHLMRRYLALAFDNIARDPAAFAAASAYRMVRLFVLWGTGDRRTAHQFEGSRLVYRAGLVLSVGYLLLFGAGVIIALKRRSPLLAFLVPILYVPLTICFVLTNMRYTITVQPLMFALVAVAVLAMLKLDVSARGLSN